MEPLKPHDLLRLHAPGTLRCEEPLPAWAFAALTGSAWVVVRRAPTPAGRVPVGVRGRSRDERFGAFVACACVAACLSPEDLAAAKGWRGAPRTPALRALDPVDELLGGLDLMWGPTGSAGFELASGVAATNDQSDLDVLIRAPLPMPLEEAREARDRLARLPVRVDAQLDVPAGAVSLDEFARGGEVMLRTPDGPRLVRFPWCSHQPAATRGRPA